MLVTINKLNPADKQLMEQIADWYLSEWKIPTERTITRLESHPNDDILFQLMLNVNNSPVATGGLYNNVSLFSVYPKFKQLQPWVALIYTEHSSRNKGLGTILLNKIQEVAKEMNFSKIYLYTFTAETLYRRNGWTEVERVEYHGHDAVVMEKKL